MRLRSGIEVLKFCSERVTNTQHSNPEAYVLTRQPERRLEGLSTILDSKLSLPVRRVA